MLTLTRTKGEGIYIGDDTTIFVEEIRGRSVRCKIKAPPTVPIHTEEEVRKILGAGGAIMPREAKSTLGKGRSMDLKPGKSCYIGADVQVLLKELRGGSVRIGVQAPSSVSVYRDELYKQMQAMGTLPKRNAEGRTLDQPKPAAPLEAQGIERVVIEKTAGGARTYTARSSSLAKVAERMDEVGRNPAPPIQTGSPARDLPRTHIVRSAGSNAPRLPRDIALAARGKSGKNNGWSR